MALPPLAPSNTHRYFVDYTNMGIGHTVMFRFANVLPDVASTFNGLLTGMIQCMMLQDAITQIRYSAVGSDVSFPVLPGPFTGTLSNGSAISDDPESVFISCPFRGNPSGRKGRMDFYFGSNVVPLDANNRFLFGTVSVLSDLEDALGNMASSGSGSGRTTDIGGGPIQYNQYWNRAKSGYWQRRQRLA